MIVFLTQYCSGDQIEKNVMGGTRSTYGQRRDVYRVWWGKPEGKRDLEDQGVDGRIILRWIFRKCDLGSQTGSIWLRIGTSGGQYTGFWWGKPEGKRYLEDQGVDGRIILRWIFRKCDLGSQTGSIWLRIGTSGGQYTGFWWGKPEGKRDLEDQGVDGRIILRWIFRKCDLGTQTGSIWLRIRTSGGHL